MKQNIVNAKKKDPIELLAEYISENKGYTWRLFFVLDFKVCAHEVDQLHCLFMR